MQVGLPKINKIIAHRYQDAHPVEFTLLIQLKLIWTHISIQINYLKLISLITVLLTFNMHSILSVTTIIKRFASAKKKKKIAAKTKKVEAR